MTVTGAQCCGELAAMMPKAGGQYVLLREAYGPAVAFVFGWALFFIIQTGKIAAVAVAFASFSGVFSEWVSNSNYIIEPIIFGRYALTLSAQQLVAILVIVVLTVINTHGLEAGKRVQNSLTFIKVAAFVALIGLGLTLGWNHGSAAMTSSWWNPWANGWSPQVARPDMEIIGGPALMMLLGLALVGPLFSQSGWNNVTFTGGEVREPGRSLPVALVKGTAIVVTLYILANQRQRAALFVAQGSFRFGIPAATIVRRYAVRRRRSRQRSNQRPDCHTTRTAAKSAPRRTHCR